MSADVIDLGVEREKRALAAAAARREAHFAVIAGFSAFGLLMWFLLARQR